MNKDEARIEELAYDISFGNLNKTRRDVCWTELLSLLMQVDFFIEESGKKRKINFRREAAAFRNAQSTVQDAHDVRGKASSLFYYDGEILAKALKSSFEKYRQPENHQHFLQIFRAHIFTKMLGIKQTHTIAQTGAEEQRAKRVWIREFLNHAAKVLGQEHVARKNKSNEFDFEILSRDKSIAYLKRIGADEEMIKNFEELFSEKHVVKNEVPMEEGNEIRYRADTHVTEDHTANEVTVMKITDIVDKGMEAACKGNYRLLPFIRYYFTLHFFEQIGTQNYVLYYMIQPYIDEYLLSFCKEYWCGKTLKKQDILARYLHLEPDTVRKRLKSVEKFLLQVQADSK